MFEKFKKGCEDLGYDYNYIKTWEYCGGNKGGRSKWFDVYFRHQKNQLDETEKCICGHKIKENCYITNGIDILILGNCCIKRFIPKNSKTCEKCGIPHKRRIVNRCDDCSLGLCDYCDQECGEYDKICDECKYKGKLLRKKCEKCNICLQTRDKNKTYCENCSKIMFPDKIYLNCPYKEKDECRSLGGVWDDEKRKWYVPIGTDSKKFTKWFLS